MYEEAQARTAAGDRELALRARVQQGPQQPLNPLITFCALNGNGMSVIACCASSRVLGKALGLVLLAAQAAVGHAPTLPASRTAPMQPTQMCWVCGTLKPYHRGMPTAQVFIIEANPRASRTVPFVAKAIGHPLAAYASLLMSGKTLADLGFTEEPVLNHVAVKEAVLPFEKFAGARTLVLLPFRCMWPSRRPCCRSRSSRVRGLLFFFPLDAHGFQLKYTSFLRLCLPRRRDTASTELWAVMLLLWGRC